jgi:hypothetical protein
MKKHAISLGLLGFCLTLAVVALHMHAARAEAEVASALHAHAASQANYHERVMHMEIDSANDLWRTMLDLEVKMHKHQTTGVTNSVLMDLLHETTKTRLQMDRAASIQEAKDKFARAVKRP